MNSFQFTGRENEGTGLFYYRARYYHPTLGRFLSEDPIGIAGGFNFYAYVGNSPISYADPSGLCVDPGGQGLRYCIDSFIADATVRGVGRGDNRGPNPVGGTFRTRLLIPSGDLPSAEAGFTGLWFTNLFERRGSLRECGVTITSIPLSGRKIVARCSATHGYNFSGTADPLSYYFVISEGADGVARALQAYSTPFPSFEIWQYGGPSGPVPVYQYNNQGAGTTIRDLSRGIGPLPSR